MIPIKPIRLNKSIYVRIPNDIVQLIEVDQSDEMIFQLEDHGTEWVITYTIAKHSRNIINELTRLDSKVLTPMKTSG